MTGARVAITNFSVKQEPARYQCDAWDNIGQSDLQSYMYKHYHDQSDVELIQEFFEDAHNTRQKYFSLNVENFKQSDKVTVDVLSGPIPGRWQGALLSWHRETSAVPLQQL